MAIVEIDWPTSGTPSIPTDYTKQNENLEGIARGYCAISLSNWDLTSTAPQVLSGSVLEANGVLYEVTSDTSISTSGASSGVVSVVFDDSVPEFKLENTEPTWYPALVGYYDSGSRYTGHSLDWDGSTSYTNKLTYNPSIYVDIDQLGMDVHLSIATTGSNLALPYPILSPFSRVVSITATRGISATQVSGILGDDLFYNTSGNIQVTGAPTVGYTVFVTVRVKIYP